MKKLFNISILAALGLSVTMTSCLKAEEDNIFDQNAVDRLEQAKVDYANILTDKGGKWAVDYFANPDEPGYVYIMTFKKDGTVVMSGDNKWINKLDPGAEYTSKPKFRTESSMWQMVGDNGPVLSFNTYNPIFHLFADPNDIAPDQDPSTWPNGVDPSPDETGHGHKGDYEFDIMKHSGDSLYMLGKKHELSIVMHRIPADTDDKQYFDSIASMLESTNITKFPELMLRGADGENYTVKDISTQIITFYPKDVSWIDRVAMTVSSNAIATLDGFRFVTPVKLVNSKKGNTLTVQRFKLQEDGSFLCLDDGVSRITCLPYASIFSDLENNRWKSKAEGWGGVIKTLGETVLTQLKTLPARARPNFFNIEFLYDNVKKQYIFRIAGHKVENDIIGNADFYIKKPVMIDDTHVKFEFTGESNVSGSTYLKIAPDIQKILDFVANNTFVLSSKSALNPSRLKLASDANAEDYINLDVQ